MNHKRVIATTTTTTRKIVPGVFCGTSDGALRIEVIEVDKFGVKMRIGSEGRDRFNVCRESARTLRDFFTDVVKINEGE